MATASDKYYKRLNRQRALPANDISTSNFTPATFEAGVFTPQKEDMSLLQRSLATLDERKEKTDQQRAAIKAALSKVNLNEADSAWKQQYIDGIVSRIDKAAQFGDYSAALEEATILAGDAVSDPELLARVQRNEQYQTWRKDIENRAIEGKIDRRTADRILEQNPYNFIARTDNNGNIVGGYNWNDTGGAGGNRVETPINKISLEPLFKEVDSIVAQHVEGGAGITSRDEKGKVVSNYSTKAAFATKTSSTVSYKDEKVIQSVFNELVKMHPELTSYLEQMKKDDAWEIQKLEQSIANATTDSPTLASDKEKLEELRRNLYTDNGLGIKSNADYLFERSDNSLKAMAYRNYTGDISISGGKKSNNSADDDVVTPEGPLKNTTFGGQGKVVEGTTPSYGGTTDRFNDYVTQGLSVLMP